MFPFVYLLNAHHRILGGEPAWAHNDLLYHPVVDTVNGPRRSGET